MIAVKAKFGRFEQEVRLGSKSGLSLIFAGSKIKQEKERWVACAPTSRFTSDGNADRVGIFSRFTPVFSGWVADYGITKKDGLLYG